MGKGTLIKESDDTIIFAWDDDGNIVYCKTFNNETERDKMMAMYKFVCTQYPNSKVMGSIENFDFTEV